MSFMRSLLVFNYEPTRECEPASRWDHSGSQHDGEGICGVAWPKQPSAEHKDCVAGVDPDRALYSEKLQPMIFDGREGGSFSFLLDDQMVVELKVASVLVHRILIDTRSSVNIITYDSLQKLKHLRRDVIPLMHLILGFGKQALPPVDVPTTYNVILGTQPCATLMLSSPLTSYKFSVKPMVTAS
ncbi:hypothetical protein Cgig2_006408 [Carnegiea gigantea]|uniref:Uncharacterized protein n=1 Tax=Carnegiea gigantea TaxID=171969 RepID=A0A9Q1JH74_9CARY|nr:hypothetical protein Cgig2_006408 [Carnegiea gigantea]